MAAILETHHYINNCFGAFYRGVLNFFADTFYPFEYKVIGTYDKAVEFFNKKKELGSETDQKLMPSITLDPSGEFQPEERGGKFLWQAPNLAPSFGAKLFEPIYKDNSIMVTPVFSRFQGTCEIMCWLQSVYEYLDVRTQFLVWAGGYNRWLRPEFFWSYIVLPDKILNYAYDNKYTDEHYQIDWRSTDAVLTLIRNMNQERVVYPVVLNPMFKIEAMSDGSEKYGGDQLASHKLTISINYEIELPTYIYLKSDWKSEKLHMNLSLGNVYSRYGRLTPADKLDQLYKHFGSERPYKDIIKYKQYEIDPCLLDDSTSFMIISSSDYETFPDRELIDWNPIISGRLLMITSPVIWDYVQPGDIIYAENFTQNELPQMRIAAGFITKNSNIYTFIRSKVSLLQKPLFAGLTDDDVNILGAYNLTDITLDTTTKIIYSKVLESSLVEKDSSGWGRDPLTKLEETQPAEDFNQAMKDKAVYDRVHTTEIFKDEDVTGEPHTDSTDYSWSSFAETKYKPIIYEFTESDINKDCTAKVQISLPIEINSAEELLLISYPGKLNYKDHYDIDFTTQTVTLFMTPKIGEIVEMYFHKPDE